MTDTQLNEMVQIAIVNMFTLSKEKNVLMLENFDINKPAHRALLQIALSFSGIFNKKVKLQMSLWNCIKFKLKYRKFNVGVYWKTKKAITCQKFIDDIETARSIVGGFNEAYERFYKF